MKIKYQYRDGAPLAVYEQIAPFAVVCRDWNNDGDEYPARVAVFALVSDQATPRDPFAVYPPKKLILTDWEYPELKNDGIIIDD